MVIGIPKEVKAHEYRVSITPGGVVELTRDGHRVLLEKGAGEGSGFPDEEYVQAGAEISTVETVFKGSELIVKVKEPIPEEYEMLKKGQALFTFLHLAPNPELIEVLLTKKITALAYETLIEGSALPLLLPMSEIAGRMSPLVAAFHLQKSHGGSGILAMGVAGVPPANVLVIGAGTVGSNAARVAQSMGMRVTVLNKSIPKLHALEALSAGRISTLPSTLDNVMSYARQADILIGAVLVTGQRVPVCVTQDMVRQMKKGSVIVDVAIDQGGCIETSRVTTHDDPVFEAHGVLHYCVANMPGAYPRTSTLALSNRTLPYVKKLASAGAMEAVRGDPALRSSLNTHNGKITHQGLASSIGMQYSDI